MGKRLDRWIDFSQYGYPKKKAFKNGTLTGGRGRFPAKDSYYGYGKDCHWLGI